jgi:hypothetical protein
MKADYTLKQKLAKQYWESAIRKGIHTYVLCRLLIPNAPSGTYGTHGTGEKSVQGFGGKAQRKETTWKTKA